MEEYINFIIEKPLYYSIDLNFEDRIKILNLLLYGKGTFDQINTIDSYCVCCKKESTFNAVKSKGLDNLNIQLTFNQNLSTLNQTLEEYGLFIREFDCSRNKLPSHKHYYAFRVTKNKIIKVGQTPSINDLTSEKLKKYKKHFPLIHKELNRAIGLSAHGVGVGSFVYLRRIIEKHIVHKNIEILKDEGKLNDQDIVGTNFKDKLKLTKSLTPSFLINNPKIYSLLSKGIHELTEKECLEYSSLLQMAIELVLDEKIKIIEKNKKEGEIQKALEKI